MFEELEFWDDLEDRMPAGQMAVDEALFRCTSRPALRAYQWASPAATFGFGQTYADVCQRTGGLPIVRRWTGGGIVYHGHDLTLALAIPASVSIACARPEAIYSAIHSAILEALRPIVPTVRLAGPSDCLTGPACFDAPALNDIISGCTKICGGALRRSREGTLYQGSLHLPKNVHRQEVVVSLATEIIPFGRKNSIERLAEDLMVHKYATASWNESRRTSNEKVMRMGSARIR